MVDGSFGETPAHGEPRVPGADGRDPANGTHFSASAVAAAQFTSTVTLVGFVMTSKTAERFCDWATSALISSGVASASMR